jgi:hypothetical protein
MKFQVLTVLSTLFLASSVMASPFPGRQLVAREASPQPFPVVKSTGAAQRKTAAKPTMEKSAAHLGREKSAEKKERAEIKQEEKALQGTMGAEGRTKANLRKGI